MGEIIKTDAFDNRMIYRIKLDECEALQLRNHMNNVYFFSEDLCNTDCKMIERGNKGGAKYFSIPLSLKSRKRYSKISYQKIEIDDKVFFVCVAHKDNLF